MTTFPSPLLDGWRAFKKGSYVQNRTRYQSLAEHGQAPSVMIIACCDSRSAPETVFNAAPGSLFVVRTVANLVVPYSSIEADFGTAAALEFAVRGLQVRHVVVLGHRHCGGIRTLLQPPGQALSPDDFVGRWMGVIRPALQQMIEGSELDGAELQPALEQAAIRNSVASLRTFPGLAELERGNRLGLHGAWFDIAQGELWTMDPSTGVFSVPN